MFYLLITANIIMVAVSLLKFDRLPPQIPLFYSKASGEDQLADTWVIVILPILMNILVVINNFLARKYFIQHELVKKIVYYLNAFIIISFTIIFIKIISLVT